MQQSPAIVERSILDSNNFGFDLLTVKKSLFTEETWPQSKGGSFSTSFSYFSGYRCQNALKIGATKPRDCRKIDFSLQQFCFWPCDRRKITFYWGNMAGGRAGVKKGGHFRPLSAVSQATEVRMPSNLVQQSPAIVERSI